jgi:hypothetical protein
MEEAAPRVAAKTVSIASKHLLRPITLIKEVQGIMPGGIDQHEEHHVLVMISSDLYTVEASSAKANLASPRMRAHPDLAVGSSEVRRGR